MEHLNKLLAKYGLTQEDLKSDETTRRFKRQLEFLLRVDDFIKGKNKNRRDNVEFSIIEDDGQVYKVNQYDVDWGGAYIRTFLFELLPDDYRSSIESALLHLSNK